ncbi:MAG TPA: class I SAM-dependent methyltransferase [Candidatus Eisenbacteria bacterium]|nr:class I SAM-dependent methyltransferase [Candidatus Eisenbacteria bacterium]
MTSREATELIAAAVDRSNASWTDRSKASWADLGAGDGMFTLALASLLVPGSCIYAVDRDSRALSALSRRAKDSEADIKVIPIRADFTKPFEWPGLEDEQLDGMLFANALHYVHDPAPLLGRLVSRLKPGGRVVVVEYDRRDPNPWVPHPIPSRDLPSITRDAGLSEPKEVRRRPSAFGGDLYVAVVDRL